VISDDDHERASSLTGAHRSSPTIARTSLARAKITNVPEWRERPVGRPAQSRLGFGFR
jgi:hypothetical protein